MKKIKENLLNIIYIIILFLTILCNAQDRITITYEYENYYIINKKVYDLGSIIIINDSKLTLTNVYTLEHINSKILYKLKVYYSKDGKIEYYILIPLLLC